MYIFIRLRPPTPPVSYCAITVLSTMPFTKTTDHHNNQIAVKPFKKKTNYDLKSLFIYFQVEYNLDSKLLVRIRIDIIYFHSREVTIR